MEGPQHALLCHTIQINEQVSAADEIQPREWRIVSRPAARRGTDRGRPGDAMLAVLLREESLSRSDDTSCTADAEYTPARACSSAVSLTSVPKIWIPAAGTDSPKYSKEGYGDGVPPRHSHPAPRVGATVYQTGLRTRLETRIGAARRRSPDRGRTPSRESGNPGTGRPTHQDRHQSICVLLNAIDPSECHAPLERRTWSFVCNA